MTKSVCTSEEVGDAWASHRQQKPCNRSLFSAVNYLSSLIFPCLSLAFLAVALTTWFSDRIPLATSPSTAHISLLFSAEKQVINSTIFSLPLPFSLPPKHKHKQKQKRSAYFQRISGGLQNPDYGYLYQPIPFQKKWLNDFNVTPHCNELSPEKQQMRIRPPKHLPVPPFVNVFELKSANPTSTSLQALGRMARGTIDRYLHGENNSSGAILFRNLHHRIQNASDFATFWTNVVQNNKEDNNEDNEWKVMDDHLSCYNRKRQRFYHQIDQVDTDVPSITIGPHNEHSCNPYPSDKIFFYALHQAVMGGETLLRRNQDIQVPWEAWNMLQQYGGIQFERSFPDESVIGLKHHHHPTAMSWQERCGTNNRTAAMDYFATKHGITNVIFEKNNTLRASNVLPGYIRDGSSNNGSSSSNNNNNHRKVWFNRIDYGFPVAMVDGTGTTTVFPCHLQSQLKEQKWHETYAFQLQRGDWLVLDNLRVQHGRLPYQDDDDDKDDSLLPSSSSGHHHAPPRQLLVTYTEQKVVDDTYTLT